MPHMAYVHPIPLADANTIPFTIPLHTITDRQGSVQPMWGTWWRRCGGKESTYATYATVDGAWLALRWISGTRVCVPGRTCSRPEMSRHYKIVRAPYAETAPSPGRLPASV